MHCISEFHLLGSVLLSYWFSEIIMRVTSISFPVVSVHTRASSNSHYYFRSFKKLGSTFPIMLSLVDGVLPV